VSPVSNAFPKRAVGRAIASVSINAHGLRPGWIQCIGMVLCGVFFLGICGIALREQIPYVKAWLNL